MSILIDGTSGITPLAFSSNLQFTSLGQRITGDFSNATLANRVAFQTSTTNGNTTVSVLPNGTATSSGYRAYNNSDPTNSGLMWTSVNASEAALLASKTGTGTYIPLTFYTGDSERMRIATSGNVGIGTSSPNAKLQINSDGGSSTYNNFHALLANRNQANGDKALVGASFVTGNGNGFAPVAFGAVQTDNVNRYGAFAVYVSSSDNVDLATQERMRINSSGYVGIATSSPATFFAIGDSSNRVNPGSGYTIQTYGAGNSYWLLNSNTNYNSGVHFGDPDSNTSGKVEYAHNGDYMIFNTAGSERMRIDSSGNVGIGTTNPASLGKFVVSGAVQSGSVYNSAVFSDAVNSTFVFAHASGIGAIYCDQALWFGSANTERMRIATSGEVYIAGTTDRGAYNLQCNGTGVWGAGAYTNGSDERLKENITSLDDCLDIVKEIRPVKFTYKEEYSKDRSVQPGFIAQELQQALAGKDYLDGIVQSGPEYLNVAYQNLIPVLLKAVQELTARVEELENNNAA